MKIFFAVLAALLFVMMFDEKQPESKRYYAYAFLGTIAGILALYIIG